MFVHRNLANTVINTDLNCRSFIQYAIEVRKVKHITVCGHYGCGGVRAAMENNVLGLIDNWLRHIKDVYQKYVRKLQKIKIDEKPWDRFCELNVIEQVFNVCHSSTVQDAWKIGQSLTLHSWLRASKMDYCLTWGWRLLTKMKSQDCIVLPPPYQATTRINHPSPPF